MKIRPAAAAMRQGIAQAEKGRPAGHKGTMRLDNMHPQSGQQGQETSAGADKDSGGRSSDGIQASRGRQGKQIRPDSRIRRRYSPRENTRFCPFAVFSPKSQQWAGGRKALRRQHLRRVQLVHVRSDQAHPRRRAVTVCGVVGADHHAGGAIPWRPGRGAVFTSAGDIEFDVRL